MANKINVYQNNTFPFTCTSPVNAVGYTPYFTAKKNISDASTLINITGIVSDSSTLAFCISSSDSSIAVGDYPYDITLEKDASIYTIVRDVISIMNGVRY